MAGILNLLQQEWVVDIIHIHREGNFSTDFLASLAQTVTASFHRLLHIPQGLIKWLDHDICGIGHEHLVGH